MMSLYEVKMVIGSNREDGEYREQAKPTAAEALLPGFPKSLDLVLIAPLASSLFDFVLAMRGNNSPLHIQNHRCLSKAEIPKGLKSRRVVINLLGVNKPVKM